MAKFSMFGAVLLAVIVVHGVCAQLNSTITTNRTLPTPTSAAVPMSSNKTMGPNPMPSDVSQTASKASATVAMLNRTNVAMASSVTGIDQPQSASASASLYPTGNTTNTTNTTSTTSTTKRSSGNQNKGSLSASFLLVLVGMALYHIPN